MEPECTRPRHRCAHGARRNGSGRERCGHGERPLVVGRRRDDIVRPCHHESSDPSQRCRHPPDQPGAGPRRRSMVTVVARCRGRFWPLVGDGLCRAIWLDRRGPRLARGVVDSRRGCGCGARCRPVVPGPGRDRAAVRELHPDAGRAATEQPAGVGRRRRCRRPRRARRRCVAADDGAQCLCLRSRCHPPHRCSRHTA